MRIIMRREGRSRTKSVLVGALSGAAGTVAMDVIRYARYKREGGTARFPGWETSVGVHGWDDASAPGLVGRKMVLALTGRNLPDSWARSMVNLVHWMTGAGWGAAFGARTSQWTKRRDLALGPALGVGAWLAAYAVLPPMEIYEPIWTYDGRTLSKDLSTHLVFGTMTAAAYVWLTRGTN